MVKICIPEDQPVSETERTWLNELYERFGEKFIEHDMDERTIVRFLRAYVNDEDPKAKSFDSIEKYLEWRETDNVDDIAATHFEGRQDFVKVWPHGMHGVSKDGHVVYIDRPGQVDPKKLTTDFSMDDYIKYHIQMMEHLSMAKKRLSAITGKDTYKHTVIMDLDGFGWKHIGDKFRGPLNKIIEIDSLRYPETLHQMYVINAPFVFRAIYAMFSPLLDDVTKSRIHIIKQKELTEYIDKSQLPEIYGGEVKYDGTERIAFITPFQTAESGIEEYGKYDVIFQGLLEERQALHQAKIDAKREAEAFKLSEEANAALKENEDGTTTTTTTTTATTDADAKPIDDADANLTDDAQGKSDATPAPAAADATEAPAAPNATEAPAAAPNATEAPAAAPNAMLAVEAADKAPAAETPAATEKAAEEKAPE